MIYVTFSCIANLLTPDKENLSPLTPSRLHQRRLGTSHCKRPLDCCGGAWGFQRHTRSACALFWPGRNRQVYWGEQYNGVVLLVFVVFLCGLVGSRYGWGARCCKIVKISAAEQINLRGLASEEIGSTMF